MGTRGLKIVRFRGRYFIYYNQFDSYPEGLGQMLVVEIPVDPEQYKLWLKRERAIYAQMTADVEEKALIITDEKIAIDLEKRVPSIVGASLQPLSILYNTRKPPLYTAREDALKTCEIIDDRLEGFPNYFCSQGINLWIEWTYTLDLDQEIFSVNSQQKCTHYRMDRIPREDWVLEVGGAYGEAVGANNEEGKDGDGESEDVNDREEQMLSSSSCPETTRMDPEHFCYASQNSCDIFKEKYSAYNFSIVKAKSQIDRSSKFADLQILSVALFEKLMSPSLFHLDIYVPTWSAEDVSFQEMAFTILSFAAGQYRFAATLDLNGEASNGYFLHLDGEEQEVLPVFGSGCRRPGAEPGSSPRGPRYWFENVLVTLIPDAIICRDAETAIAEVAEFGFAAGNDDFYALLFSLANAIMIHVTVDSITHTPITKLLTSNEPSQKDDSLDTLCDKLAGFISLINFFNAAADRYVAPFDQGRFPTEIYSKIYSYVDDDITYNSLAKASKVFRDARSGMVVFGRKLKTPKFLHSHHSQREKWIFAFEDEDEDVEYVMKVISPEEEDQKIRGKYWSPVIGSKRQTFIPAIEIYFETITVRSKRVNRRHAYEGYGPFNSNAYTVKVNWKDSQPVTARQVQEIWAYYLQGILLVEKYRFDFCTSPCTFTCTLIPHYREIHIMYDIGHMWVCVRRPVDGDTPEKRAATLAYVISRFTKESKKSLSGQKHAQDGDIILVAFGLQASLYHWKMADDDGSGSLVEFMHFDDYSKEEVRLKMESEVLMPLLEGIAERKEMIALPDRTGDPSS